MPGWGVELPGKAASRCWPPERTTERLRQLTLAAIGQPRRTVLHGQSWGAGVAARMAERYVTPDIDPRRTTPGPLPYDAVLLDQRRAGGGDAGV